MPRRARSHYDAKWRQVRRLVLERDNFRCYFPGCIEKATEGDHIIPIDDAPHLRLDPQNVRASCKKHNAGRVSRRLSAMAHANRSAGSLRDW